MGIGHTEGAPPVGPTYAGSTKILGDDFIVIGKIDIAYTCASAVVVLEIKPFAICGPLNVIDTSIEANQ